MFRTLPLFLTYVAFPIVNIIAQLIFKKEIFRNWIDVAWLILGFFSFFRILVVGKIKFKKISLEWLFVLFIVFDLVLIKFNVPLINSEASFYPYLMDLKPLFYFLVSLLWIAAFDKPSKEDFVRFGVWLSMIIILDLIIESINAGQFIRAYGSGEINYDACLLLISLCASLGTDREQKNTIIYLGLLFALSRTALVSCVFLIIMFSAGSFKKKFLLALVSFGFVIVSFETRSLPIAGIENIDRYWMWNSAIKLFTEQPWNMFFGFPIGKALPVQVPASLAWLWDKQAQDYSLSGVYPFNFHAFWLRLAISWGLIVSLVVFYCLIRMMIQNKYSVFLKSVILIIILQGFTMGLFYLSNVSLPLLLSIYLAVSETKGAGNKNENNVGLLRLNNHVLLGGAP